MILEYSIAAIVTAALLAGGAWLSRRLLQTWRIILTLRVLYTSRAWSFVNGDTNAQAQKAFRSMNRLQLDALRTAANIRSTRNWSKLSKLNRKETMKAVRENPDISRAFKELASTGL